MGIPPAPHIRSFISAEELMDEMDDAGIDRAFVSHFAAQRRYPDGNYELMRAIEKCSRLMPCWLAYPAVFHDGSACRDFISGMKSEGVRMARVQPGSINGYSMHRWAMREFVEGLVEIGAVLCVDLLEEQGLSHKAVPLCEWENLYQFASACASLPIILTGRKLSVSKVQVMGLLKSCGNVMLDISSFQTWRSTETVSLNPGASQMVFGSAMPYFDAAQFIVQVEKAMIPESDKQKIASGNISAILDV